MFILRVYGGLWGFVFVLGGAGSYFYWDGLGRNVVALWGCCTGVY